MYQSDLVKVFQIGNDFIAETKDKDGNYISYQSDKLLRWKYDNSYIDYLNGDSKIKPNLLAEDYILFLKENEYSVLRRYADLNVKLLTLPPKNNNIKYKVVRKVITSSYHKIEFLIDGITLFGYVENREFKLYDLTKTIIEKYQFCLLMTYKSKYYDLFYELYCYCYVGE